MSLILGFAEHEDASRVAEIHVAAFKSNEMLLAQFPTPKVRDALQKSIELKALADIDDSRTTVLVVRYLCSEDAVEGTVKGTVEEGTVEESSHECQSKGKVIAFAKWAHSVSNEEDYVEPPWIWPAGTDLKILKDWTEVTDKAQLRAVGEAPCYRLTFMGTDPAYERRGAATMMVKWGIDQSKCDHVPAYLESTLEAVPFYRKLGFVDVERLSLAYLTTGTNVSKVYEEISFVYR
ncbi:putative GNAT family acetyltransferase [Hypoxylon sp. FL1150]|nr:putative GNAT family acetyltransferase [Hypoxylon sp. FL1150]